MGIGANITARARHISFQIFGASIYIFLHRYRVRRRPQTGLPVHPCGPELAGSCAVVLRAFFRLSLFFHLVTLGRRQRKMERERKRRKRRGVVGRGLYIRDISRGIVSVVVVRLLNDFLHHRYYFLDETRALLDRTWIYFKFSLRCFGMRSGIELVGLSIRDRERFRRSWPEVVCRLLRSMIPPLPNVSFVRVVTLSDRKFSIARTSRAHNDLVLSIRIRLQNLSNLYSFHGSTKVVLLSSLPFSFFVLDGIMLRNIVSGFIVQDF